MTVPVPVAHARAVLAEVEKGTRGIELNFRHHLDRMVSALAGLLACLDLVALVDGKTVKQVMPGGTDGTDPAAPDPLGHARTVLAEVERRRQDTELDAAGHLCDLIPVMNVLLAYADDLALIGQRRVTRRPWVRSPAYWPWVPKRRECGRG